MKKKQKRTSDTDLRIIKNSINIIQVNIFVFNKFGRNITPFKPFIIPNLFNSNTLQKERVKAFIENHIQSNYIEMIEV